MHTGEATEAADLAGEQWSNLVSGTNELGRVMLEEYGIELVFHPHVDTHVDTQERIERFLQDTDPRYVNLCLDTGHIAYAGGDNVAIVQGFPERIHYVHLKLVDPEVRDRVRRENIPLSEAVKLGAMVEPPYGEPAMPALLHALAPLELDPFSRSSSRTSTRSTRRPAADRRAHRRLLRGLRARPRPTLALPALT